MKNPKTLVVEDMQSMRDALVSILKLIGLTNIDKAVNGEDAYEKVTLAHEENSPYELILCDVHMPKCDGINFLKKLAADDHRASIPVLMVSTENEYNVVVEAISAGAKDYIVKPFTQDTVLKKIKRYL
jgi:two-component system chemotaxis response regulator CheY